MNIEQAIKWLINNGYEATPLETGKIMVKDPVHCSSGSAKRWIEFETLYLDVDMVAKFIWART